MLLGSRFVESGREDRLRLCDSASVRNTRLLDLSLVWAFLSLIAFGQRSPQSTPVPPTRVPQPVVTPVVPSTPDPGAGSVLWSDPSLALKLRRLAGPAGPRRAPLQLSLSNRSANFCWIPGTFCQEGKEADWWSHAVRVTVESGRPNLKPRASWRVGPRYGERDLHQHDSFLSFIGPEQQMTWEFCLDDLIEGVDGGPISESWERAEGHFWVTCELSQPGHKLLSNRLEILP